MNTLIKLYYGLAICFSASLLLTATVNAEVFLNVEGKQQIGNWDCGPTSSAMLASYYLNKDISRKQLANLVGREQGRLVELGSKPKSLMSALQKVIGNKGKVRHRAGDYRDWRQFIKGKLDQGKPLIALRKFDQFNAHYVVLNGYNSKYVFFQDPGFNQPRQMGWNAFSSEFRFPMDKYGQALRALGVDRQNLIWIDMKGVSPQHKNCERKGGDMWEDAYGGQCLKLSNGYRNKNRCPSGWQWSGRLNRCYDKTGTNRGSCRHWWENEYGGQCLNLCPSGYKYSSRLGKCYQKLN